MPNSYCTSGYDFRTASHSSTWSDIFKQIKTCLQVHSLYMICRHVFFWTPQASPSFSITLTRLAVGFGPLSSPTFFKKGFTPWIPLNPDGSPAHRGFGDLEIGNFVGGIRGFLSFRKLWHASKLLRFALNQSHYSKSLH